MRVELCAAIAASVRFRTRFDPSRFLPDVPPPRLAWTRFGSGPHLRRLTLALTELVLVVASLVRAFRIELPPHRLGTPVGLVTVQPDVPLPSR